MDDPYRETGDEPAGLGETLLGGVTDAMVTEAAGLRELEAHEAEATAAGSGALESTALPADWRATISRAAYDFVVRWETGGKAYYEGVIKSRPVWPAFQSGVTIGCGWDLGYNSEAAFRAQWHQRLGAAAFDRLRPALGFRTAEPGRAAKVERMKALIRSYADIRIPWATAIEHFDTIKLRLLVQQLYQALDNLDRLHPHCRGALLSLVFNRGAPFANQSDRFREMRAIAAAMRAGTPETIATIPAELRSMARIWPGTSLAERRKGEAALFEAGLAEARLLESLVA